MIKALFFDAGPIISLVMSRLGWLLPLLKQKYGGKFYITPAVHRELIERPLQVKRFEFEALQVMKLVREGVLEVYKNVNQPKVKELKLFANSAFKIKDQTLDVVQEGELESISAASEIGAEAVVMDERTLRLLIEHYVDMQKLLELRFHKEVKVDLAKLNQFSQQFQEVKIIRSIELVSVAYQLGLLDAYVPKMKEGKEVLIDAVLWATKFNGCAVTDKEIEEIKESLL